VKRWQYILGGLVVVFIIIQFIPADLPGATTDNPGDMIKSGLVSQDVAILLKTSCYNCHSNETKYPWYSHMAPSSWLIARDVRVAREELNFSNWQDYDMSKMLGKLDDITSEVGEGRMPMKIYTLMHPAARLDDAERALIVAWAEETMDLVAEEDEEEEEEEEEEIEEE